MLVDEIAQAQRLVRTDAYQMSGGEDLARRNGEISRRRDEQSQERYATSSACGPRTSLPGSVPVACPSRNVSWPETIVAS